MSLWRNTVRSLGGMARTSFLEAMAYRAELLVWVLTTTMPLIMLALWSSLARESPVGRFGPSEFTAYFFATFIVRQLVACWVAWELNFAVRNGTLSPKLLRPVFPLAAYAVENLAAIPLRMIVAIPAAVIGLILAGSQYLPHTTALWCAWLLSMLGAWLLNYFANIAIGSLSLFMESSIKVMEMWLAAMFVFSGYLFPLELLSPHYQAYVDWLPFRYLIGLPVEILTSAHSLPVALRLLAQQWAYVSVFGSLAAVAWRVGLKQYAAYGG